MSGFSFLFHRNGQKAHSQELDLANKLLRHRGPDGLASGSLDCFAFSQFHFWTTPEDKGKSQLLFDDASGFLLLFDGRVDNRSDLIVQLGIDSSAKSLSDGQLAQRCLLRFGPKILSSFVGPYALVWCDTRQRKVLFARDPVGDRTLFYFSSEHLLAICSEEAALLKLAKIKPEPNPARVAAFFAACPPQPEHTFFNNVWELSPGHCYRVEESHEKNVSFWNWAEQITTIDHGGEQEITREFRRHLTQAVDARCRSIQAPGIMLSGGLDSSTIAGLASSANQTHSRPKPHAYSYILPTFPACDESLAISQIASALGLKQTTFRAETLWPLKEWFQWRPNPNGPEENIFRLLLNKIHHFATSHQRRVLLSGDFGDHHFAGAHRWLFEGLQQKKWRLLQEQSRLNLKIHGFRTSLRRMGFGKKAHLRLPKKPPAFFTHEGRAAWSPSGQPRLPGIAPIRSRALLDPMMARSFTAEIPAARRAMIDLRHPFRDRRLIKYSLGIPGYYLYRNGQKKWLLRQISDELFAKETVQFKLNSNLHPFFQQGLERERAKIAKFLEEQQDLWQIWVKPASVYASLKGKSSGNGDALLWWHCLTYSRWYQTFA